MGIYSELLAGAETIDVELPTSSQHSTARKELTAHAAELDLDVPAAYDTRDEVQELSATDATSGNFTITVTLANGETFTTGNISFDDTASEIETIIDTAADGEVTGWTAGDISVSGGPADTNPVVLTFDGDSVAGANHPESVATDEDLMGGTVGEFSTTTNGQGVRAALAALAALGCIEGTPPDFQNGEGIGELTAGDTNRPNRPSQSLVSLLLSEAVHDEEIDYDTLAAIVK